MYLVLKFMSLNHFELSFVHSMRYEAKFILLHVAIQFFWYHFLKRLSWHLRKSVDRIHKGLFLGSLFCPIGFYVYLLCQYYNCFWLLWLCSMFWNQKVWDFQLCSSFIWLFFGYLGSFEVTYEFEGRLSVSKKKKQAEAEAPILWPPDEKN